MRATHAREAARRAGMSVGQWLNSVILETVDEPDDDDAYDDPYAHRHCAGARVRSAVTPT